MRHDLIGSKKRAQETFLEHSKKRFSLCQNVVKNGSKNVLENGGLGVIAILRISYRNHRTIVSMRGPPAMARLSIHSWREHGDDQIVPSAAEFFQSSPRRGGDECARK